MKAKFYSKNGQVVWECTKDARYELANGTRAINKKAVRGELYDLKGQLVDQATYSVRP